jgi:hypothetical protein
MFSRFEAINNKSSAKHKLLIGHIGDSFVYCLLSVYCNGAIKNRNSVGLSGSPCFTPVSRFTGCVYP